jgi:hypothetical protein
VGKNIEIESNIASLSFFMDRIEEVEIKKIYRSSRERPDAYSVSWSEWMEDADGKSIRAEVQPQTQKIKQIQKFEHKDLAVAFEQARIFFLTKVDEISRKYKENGN